MTHILEPDHCSKLHSIGCDKSMTLPRLTLHNDGAGVVDIAYTYHTTIDSPFSHSEFIALVVARLMYSLWLSSSSRFSGRDKARGNVDIMSDSEEEVRGDWLETQSTD